MLTKAQFFALLNDADNEIGATAHIAVFEMPEYRGGMQSLIIKQNGAPNAWLSNHKATTTTNAAFTKYHTWLNEWFVARTAEAEARLALTTTEEVITLIKESPVQAEFFVIMTAEERQAAVEAAHTEALAEDAKRAALRCRDAAFFGGLDSFGRRVVVEAAHGEALRINEALAAGLNEEWALKVGAEEISLADALGDMDTDTECAAMEASPAMQRYTVWLDRAKQKGSPLASWNCPACNMLLHSLYPDNVREEWDTATMCPSCDHLYFKITRRGEDGTGIVELRAL